MAWCGSGSIAASSGQALGALASASIAVASDATAKSLTPSATPPESLTSCCHIRPRDEVSAPTSQGTRDAVRSYDLRISAARADALFAPPLQRSDKPSARQARQAIAT